MPVLLLCGFPVNILFIVAADQTTVLAGGFVISFELRLEGFYFFPNIAREGLLGVSR